MSNGFAAHGLEHTSASQINMFSDSAAAWVKNYLYKNKGWFGFPPMRGIVIEDIVVNVLLGQTFEDALEQGLQKFNSHHVLSSDPKKAKERAMIEPCALIMLNELDQYGTPDFDNAEGQNKIEILCRGEGFEINIVGYLDLVYHKHGLMLI